MNKIGSDVFPSLFGRLHGTPTPVANLGKRSALSLSVLTMLALFAMPTESAQAAEFFVNDGVDGECARMADGNPVGQSASNIIVGNPACNVSSVAGLAGAGAANGSMVLNGNGAFLLGNLNISGALDVNNNQIHSVASGTAPTDAANMSQLQSAAQSVATALGGGSSASADGTVSAPTYNVQGTVQSTVASALTSLDAGVNQRVAYDAGPSGAINYSSVTLGNGNAVGGVALHNVAPGVLPDDAVNLGQLQDVQNAIPKGSPYVAINGKNDGSDNAKAVNFGAVAIGPGASAQEGGIAIGSDAEITPDYVAGGGNDSGYNSAIAIGESTLTTGLRDIAIGSFAKTDSVNAPGTSAGDYSLALGYSAQAIGGANTALGQGASAGNGNNRAHWQATAIGGVASASAFNSVALGYGSIADVDNAVSVGAVGAERQIINVAAGMRGTDAVNVDQLSPVISGLGGGAKFNADGTITGPTYNVQAGTQTTVGDALNVLDAGVNRRVAYDQAADGSTDYNSVTLGNGQSTGPVGLHNIAVGDVSASSTDAVNGSQLNATNQNVTVNAQNINALGGRVAVNEGNINDLIVGHAGLVQQVDANSPITVAANSGGTSVDLTGTAGGRRLTGVAVGDIGAASADAVNGAQLFATNQQVGTNTSNIAGNTTNINNLLVGTAGLVQQANSTAPITVAANNGGTLIDISGTAGDRRITGLADGEQVNDAVNLGQLQDVQGKIVDLSDIAVLYDSPDKQSITLGGAVAAPVAIHNLADGALSASSTDAVNGSQLYKTNQQVGTNTSNITSLDGRVTTNEGNINNLLIGHAGLVQQADANAPVTVAANSGGNVMDVAGTSGSRRITGVADGDISAASSDAIDGSQLYNTNQSVAINTQNIGKLDGRVTVNEGNINDLLIGHAGLVQQVDTNASVTVAAGSGGTSVNFNGVAGDRQLKGVAAGTVDDDAVNVSQLNNLSDQIGVIDNSTVKYDDGSKTSVTLGGVGAAMPVALRNVADGELSAVSHDAVNGGQLYNTNQNVATNTQNIGKLDGRVTVNEGNINDLMIGHAGLVQQVDTSAPVTVAATSGGTLVDISGTAGDRQITGVAAGTKDNDAVNLSQLNDLSGYVGDLNALAVKYDDKSKASVTLGGVDATSPVALRNIADGELSSTSHDAVNGSQLFTTNQQVDSNTSNISDLLIGHAGLVQQADATAPVTIAATSGGTLVTVNGTDGDRQIRGVAVGTQDDDAVNLSQLKDLAGYVGDIDALAVKYDDVGRSSITLGGAGASAPVAIHNLANGVDTYDAVNFGQLSSLQSDLQNQIGGLDGRVTILENEDRTPPYLDGAGGSGTNGKANAGNTPGVALGYNTVATGDNASAVGQNAQALGTYGLAVGNDSYAAGDNDTAIGGNAKVNADNSIAVGANSSVAAQATNAVAVGANSSVSASSGTAVGQGASVTSSATNSVALGAGSVADRANSVSVGASGSERQITNVAAGTQTTDAVNVGQLQGLQDWTTQKVDDLQQLINHNQRQANRGIASSAALVNNMPYVPGKVALSAGAASYRGESALGVAVSRWSQNGRVNLNAGVSVARGDAPIFRVGVGVVLGE